MTIARFIALLLGTVLVLLASTPQREVAAHTSGFPLVRYNPFRLPWTAEVAWDREEGSAPGTGFHTGASSWAIDFSGPGNLHGQPVKSVGGGTLSYVDLGAASYGLHARVIHPGGFLTIYAHLDAIGAPGGSVTQGTWVGNVGDTGNSEGSHLHFEARDPSGNTFDATLSGVSIGHLAFENETPHLSDNQGAGYIDARIRNDAFLSRALSPDTAASTRRSSFSTCDVATYSVYFCNFSVVVVGQDFIGPRVGATGLHDTFSLVGTPNSSVVVKVSGVIQKAYQSRLSTNGAKVASVLGRPVGEQGVFAGQPFQGFEFGSILIGATTAGNPVGYDVTVMNSVGTTILQRNFKARAGAGDCASVTENAEVNIVDIQQVAAHSGSDGSGAYDRLYDFFGFGIAGFSNGAVNVIDTQQVAARVGSCGPEL